MLTPLLLLGTEAKAQPPRFGLQVDAGVALGLGPTARSSIGLLDPRSEGDLTVGTPLLTDAYRNPSLRLGLTLQLAELEVRYAAEYASWRRSRLLCSSENTATLRGSGAIDDRGVSWDCNGSNGLDVADTRPAFLVHHLGGGYRFYGPEWRGEFLPWAVLGGGLSLTRFDRDAQRRRLRAGLHLVAGGGIDLASSGNITVAIDTRYQATFLAATARFSDNARRATVLERNVVSAVFDIQHALLLTIGLRTNLR